MNGKIKTKFAALFAVALMITVCVVPVVDNAGVDAAPVSSSNGEVFEGYDITLYKEGGDYSGLVYYGTDPKIAGYTVKAAESGDNAYYYNPKTEKFLTVDQVPGYVPTQATYGFPMIQFVYSYDDADVNTINYTVKINKDNVNKFSVDTASLFGNGLENDRSQGVLTVQMGTGDFDHKLGLTPELIAGDFEVIVEATQGVKKQIINETVNAGAAITVSGTIYDAEDEPIKAIYKDDIFQSGMKVDIRVNGSSSPYWVNTDANGKYSLDVVAESTVSIAGISYFLGDDDNEDAYTFESETYDFGTIKGSDKMDFKSKQSTGGFQIKSASNVALSGFESGAELTWMYQTGTKDGNDVEYNVSESAGNYTGAVVNVLTDVTDKDGKVYFTYIEPKLAQGATKGAYDAQKLVLTEIDEGTMYSFLVDNEYTDTEKTLDKQIKANNTIDVLATNPIIKAVESTGVVKVTSKNNVPLQNQIVEIAWYYEYKNGDDIVVEPESSSSTVVPTTEPEFKYSSLTSDKNGEVTFSYVTPVLPTGYSAALIVSGVDGNSAEATDMDYDSVAVADDQSIEKTLKGKSGMAKVNNGSASIKSLDNVWKVSGSYGKNLTMTVTNSVTPDTVKSNDKGEYAYYVKDGVSSTITVTGYTPSSYTTPSMSKDIVVNFSKNVAVEGNLPVKYKVEGGPQSITYTYSINGVEATTVAGAEITLNAPAGSSIKVSATADGYDIAAFDGYVAKAVKMTKYYVKALDGEEGIAGAAFDVTYTENDEQKTIALTADKDGIASFTIPTAVQTSTFIMSKDGKVLTPTNGQQFYVGLNQETGYTVDLSKYYPGEAEAEVSITYGAVYNVEDVALGPVAYEPLVGYTASTNNVVDSIALKAPSIDNFEFVAWMVDGVVVSEKADYTLVVEDGEEYDAVALYSAAHYEEPAEGLSMNVLVIGIVILILGILAVAYGIISKKQ